MPNCPKICRFSFYLSLLAWPMIALGWGVNPFLRAGETLAASRTHPTPRPPHASNWYRAHRNPVMPKAGTMRTAILALALTTALSSCETESPAGYSTRETLPNGAVLVRHPDLPAIDAVGPDVTEAQLDLQFGSVDGTDPNLIFADIRGIQAAGDGTIYVLDFQATQVRAYDPGGQYLRTVVRGGEGPGEISAANGILLSGDTLLWVHDHGKWTIIGVDPVGEEVHRFGKPIMSYGYIWDGVFDDRGRYWRHTFHQEGGFTYPPPPGLSSTTYRNYYMFYDLASEA